MSKKTDKLVPAQRSPLHRRKPSPKNGERESVPFEDRRIVHIDELTNADIAAIATAEVPAEYAMPESRARKGRK